MIITVFVKEETRFSPLIWKDVDDNDDGQTVTNPVALVRERNIPTDRRPFVGEVSASILLIEDVVWSA
jgi:hypothetical protein